MDVSNTARSPLTLAALATVAIPGLDVVATHPPAQSGADFDVAGLTDAEGRRWMIRAPKLAAAGAALEAEVDVLGSLAAAADAGGITFDVPRPQGFAPLPEGGRAMVYRELPGRGLDVDSLSADSVLPRRIGRAIARLHELDPTIIADAGLPVYDAQDYRTRRLAELDEAARTGHVPAALLLRWEHALEDVRLWQFRATVVHGDLAAEHILIASDDVAAFLDWADARVADPADDLAWLLAAAPEDAAETILSAYRRARSDTTDEFLDARAVLAGELALARWLMHGVRHRDEAIIDDAVQMLLDLDEAVAEAPPIGSRAPDHHTAPDLVGAGGAGGEADAADGVDLGYREDDQGAVDSPDVEHDDGAETAGYAGAYPERSAAREAEDGDLPPHDDGADDQTALDETGPIAPNPAPGHWGDDAATAPLPVSKQSAQPMADPASSRDIPGTSEQAETEDDDLQEPDYLRRSGRRGVDDSPTTQLPATET